MMSFGSCFIRYYKGNDMKHILFLNGSVFTDVAVNLTGNTPELADSLLSFSLGNIPAVERFSGFPPWGYLLIGAGVVSASLLSWLFFSNRRLRREAVVYRERSAEQLRFIRSLLDLCYTYRESPLVFIDKFKDKVNIRELKSYTLIDIPPRRFEELKEDERLLCLLWESGFTQRELCVIFNLKKVSNLYTKYHRIKNKMKSR